MGEQEKTGPLNKKKKKKRVRSSSCPCAVLKPGQTETESYWAFTFLLHKILQEQQLLSNILLLGGCSASRCNTVFLNFKNK